MRCALFGRNCNVVCNKIRRKQNDTDYFRSDSIFTIRYFASKPKNNVNRDAQSFIPPEAGSREERKARKKFQEFLKCATAIGVDSYPITCMDNIAKAYALGDGTEKNIEKAKEWAERSVRAQLQQKAYMSSYGPSGYAADLSFFTDGKLIPKDLQKAEKLALLLALHGTKDAKKF